MDINSINSAGNFFRVIFLPGCWMQGNLFNSAALDCCSQLKIFYVFISSPFLCFLTVALNVPEQASSIDGSFQPDLVAFARQFFLFAPFNFGFRKIEVGGGYRFFKFRAPDLTANYYVANL